jgi:hypothetical protein
MPGRVKNKLVASNQRTWVGGEDAYTDYGKDRVIQKHQDGKENY